MSELYERSILKLELDRVLEMLAACAGSQEGKAACLRLHPNTDLDDVNQMLEETTEAFHLSSQKGYPRFSELYDVSASVERTAMGGALRPGELLQVAGLLRCARNVREYVSEEDKESSLYYRFTLVTPNKYLEDRIAKSILSEEEIADQASPELADIRRHMRIQSNKIKETLQKTISSPSFSSNSSPLLGYLPHSAEFKPALFFSFFPQDSKC